jgi:RecA/RadA recombinase
MDVVKGKSVLTISGHPGSGKSMAAVATAFLVAKAGGKVLFIDGLGSPDYFVVLGDLPEGITVVSPGPDKQPVPFVAADYFQAAQAYDLVVLDHLGYDDPAAFLIQANELARTANVRLLVTTTRS